MRGRVRGRSASQVSAWSGPSPIVSPSAPRVLNRMLDSFNRSTPVNVVGVESTWDGVTGPNYLNGSWVCDGSKLVGSSAEGRISWTLPVPTYTWEATLGGPVTGIDCGVLIRVAAANQFMMIHLMNGITDIYRYDWGYSLLTSLGTAGWTTGDTIRVEVTTSTIAVYRRESGGSTFTQVGSTYSNGDFSLVTGVGLRSNSTPFYIDSVEARW